MRGRPISFAVFAALASMGAAAQAGVKQTFADAAKALKDSSSSEAGVINPRPPRYTKFGGYGVREGKRRAEKRRNVLRAKGHHRQAVR